MIKIENVETYGWEAAVRGMRNPMNSWERSDSGYKPVICPPCNDERVEFVVGKADHDLMMKLAKAGSVHAKYRRMITVTVDITAPLYWWKEFDTYKVGTVANSCSTMHKIHEKEFELSDFSWERLNERSLRVLEAVIDQLNESRQLFLASGKDKTFWWQMIQLLPSSYEQRRTIQMNYETLVGMYRDRHNHKLDEWQALCRWIKTLPYSELITGEEA